MVFHGRATKVVSIQNADPGKGYETGTDHSVGFKRNHVKRPQRLTRETREDVFDRGRGNAVRRALYRDR